MDQQDNTVAPPKARAGPGRPSGVLTYRQRVLVRLAALVPAIVGLGAAVVIGIGIDRDERRAHVEDHAALAGDLIDSRLDKLRDLAEFCATAPELTRDFDLDRLAQTCGRYARSLRSWFVVVALGDQHEQIINTRPDAPEVLPRYPRTREHVQLIATETRSRQSGRAEISDIFGGRIYVGGIIAAGRYTRMADGRPAMVYVGRATESLYAELFRVLAEDQHALVVIDGAGRVVGASPQAGRFVGADLPDWMKDRVAAGRPGSVLAQPGSGSSPHPWNVGFSPLDVAEGWMMVSAERSGHIGLRWSLVSEQSAIAAGGFGITLLLLWLVGYRAQTAARLARADRAEAEALQRDREKSRFLASFAHDIRGPMVGLLGTLEALRATIRPPVPELDGAERTAENLLQLIDDILELSFLGSGEMRLTPTPVDLRRMGRDVLDGLEPLATARGLALQLNIAPPRLPMVEVDRVRLQQVLANLVSNGVKYTRAGSVTLQITSREISRAEVSVRFEIRDTGVGIAPELMSNIFKEYGRLEQPPGNQQPGFGLGLAICMRILRAMGSRLDVHSTPGEGSTFFFDLRLPVRPASGAAEDDASLSGQTILFAEDEPAIAALTQRKLEGRGATVVHVPDGTAARAALETLTPDLLLLDLQMPGLDGLTLLRQLRAEPGARPFPIFILTSHIGDLRAEEARTAGADATFTKPVQVEVVAAELRRWRSRQDPAAR